MPDESIQGSVIQHAEEEQVFYQESSSRNVANLAVKHFLTQSEKEPVAVLKTGSEDFSFNQPPGTICKIITESIDGKSDPEYRWIVFGEKTDRGLPRIYWIFKDMGHGVSQVSHGVKIDEKNWWIDRVSLSVLTPHSCPVEAINHVLSRYETPARYTSVTNRDKWLSKLHGDNTLPWRVKQIDLMTQP